MALKRGPMTQVAYMNVFEESLVDRLEDNVTQQLSGNTFDLDANLHLLKLYQIFLHKMNVEGIRKVLLKALMHLRANAFNLAMYLVPDKYHGDPQVEAFGELARQLETAHYAAFWELTDQHKDLLLPAVGFNHAIRDFILEVVTMTYRTVDVPFLAEALRLPEPELKTYLQSKGMKPEGGFLQFPENPFTTLKPRASPQNIQFEQVAKIFA